MTQRVHCPRGRAIRPILAAAVMAVFVLAVPSHAATTCAPYLTDARGDAAASDPSTGASLGSTGSDPAMDVLSADVAADGSTFSAVVRAAADMRTSTAVSGHSVELVFRALGESLWNLGMTFQADGSTVATFSKVEGASGTALAAASSLSADGRQLRLSVPTSFFAELAGKPLRKGAAVYDLHLYTNRGVAAGGSGVFTPVNADSAVTARRYAVGGRSCIKPG